MEPGSIDASTLGNLPESRQISVRIEPSRCVEFRRGVRRIGTVGRGMSRYFKFDESSTLVPGNLPLLRTPRVGRGSGGGSSGGGGGGGGDGQRDWKLFRDTNR